MYSYAALRYVLHFSIICYYVAGKCFIDEIMFELNFYTESIYQIDRIFVYV